MAVSVAGLAPAAAHSASVAAVAALAGAAARVAVMNAHPPDVTRPAGGIGGVNLCGACSPGASRVAWPCQPYRMAADTAVTGLVN